MNKLMAIAAAGIFLVGCRTAKVETSDNVGETSEEVVCMCVSELILVHARLLDAHGCEVKPKQ